MKTLNQIIYLLVFLIMYASNLNATDNAFHSEEYPVVSKFNKTSDGKVYYEVNGVPFMFIGTEIRVDAFQNCENQTIEDIEKYFEASANLGVTTVLIPIEWKRIEPLKDSYDFADVAKLLNYAKKYDLKVEFLWFSTNMCGDSHSFHIPDYIWYDEVTYPKYQTTHKGWWWSYYGYMGLLWLSNPALLDRETKVVNELMNFVYDWDRDNGNSNVLIGVQLYSEPDAFARWRLTLQNVRTPDGTRKITEEEAWDDLCTALDVVGVAFKESKYKVLTRTNLIMLQEANSNWESFAPRIFNLEGVDAVGNDSYTTDLRATRQSLIDLAGREYDYSNWPHIAENKGSYENTPSLILLTVALGGGYNIYDIATPKHFIDNPGNDPNFAGGIDHGILTTYNYLNPNPDTDLQDKPHTQETRVLIQGIKDAAYPLIMSKISEIATFNLVTDHPQSNFEQTVTAESVSYHFKTSKPGVGYALRFNEDIVMFSTQSCTITMNNIEFTSVEYGNYTNTGDFISIGTSTSFSGNNIYIDGGKVYRVKIDSVLPLPEECPVYMVLNFEDEIATNEIIAHLHTHDWQTNPAYTRDLFALNPNKTGVNQTARCASFSGYYSGNEWWYGLDIVLKNPIQLSTNMKYIHAVLMTNRTDVDTNRGLLILNSQGLEVSQTWFPVSDKWVDYVFPIPEGTTDISEFRFMFNHQASGLVTYLDEIVISNDPNPRQLITGSSDILDLKRYFTVFSKDRNISIKSNNDNFSVRMYNLRGSLIFNQLVSGNFVNVPVQESGLYLVKCNSEVVKIHVY
jgi:hypothetical protein